MDYSKLTKISDGSSRVSTVGGYDYEEALYNDIDAYINDVYGGDLSQFDDIYAAEEQLNDELWTEDSVTGNGSGSYFGNINEAAIAVGLNWDLLKQACEDFGGGLPDGPEAADVTIRCYLLGQVLGQSDVIQKHMPADKQ